MITVEQIRAIIAEETPDVEMELVKNDVRLREYEIDSLDFFNIMIGLQTLTDIEVPDEDLEELTTIDSIYNYFQNKSS